MDSLNRAKEFIARRASKLAMVVVPLAALAAVTPAKATTLMLDPSSTDTCFTTNSGSCLVSPSSAAGANAGLNWLQMSGNASASFASGGGWSVDFLLTSGTTNGALLPAGQVPVYWNFTVTGGTGATNWELFYYLDYSGGDYLFSTSGTTSSGVAVLGNGLLTIPTDTNITAYAIYLDTSDTSSYSVNIPANATLIFNQSGVSAPEPSTLWLMAGGGVALLLGRKRLVRVK